MEPPCPGQSMYTDFYIITFLAQTPAVPPFPSFLFLKVWDLWSGQWWPSLDSRSCVSGPIADWLCVCTLDSSSILSRQDHVLSKGRSWSFLYRKGEEKISVQYHWRKFPIVSTSNQVAFTFKPASLHNRILGPTVRVNWEQFRDCSDILVINTWPVLEARLRVSRRQELRIIVLSDSPGACQGGRIWTNEWMSKWMSGVWDCQFLFAAAGLHFLPSMGILTWGTLFCMFLINRESLCSLQGKANCSSCWRLSSRRVGGEWRGRKGRLQSQRSLARKHWEKVRKPRKANCCLVLRSWFCRGNVLPEESGVFILGCNSGDALTFEAQNTFYL